MGIRSKDLSEAVKRRMGLSKPAAKPAGGSYRSKLEAAYAAELATLQALGEVVYWRYEPFRWRLGPGVSYCPDFLVMTREGRCRVIEVKGWMREDARIKLRWFVQQAPPSWEIVLVTREGGQWRHEPVTGAAHE